MGFGAAYLQKPPCAATNFSAKIRLTANTWENIYFNLSFCSVGWWIYFRAFIENTQMCVKKFTELTNFKF